MADYIWPWPKDTRISQEFGTNPGGVNPAGGHTGTDGALPAGTPLRAPADGVVTLEGWMQTDNGSDNPYWLTTGGGICLAIDFGDGKPAMTVGHLSATFVNKGDRVKQGQIVAEVGNTGKWTTGPHAHFEMLPPTFYLNSPTYGRVNPRTYCTAYWEDVANPVLKPFQRMTKTKVWERSVPDHTADATRIKLWDEETIFDFGGYVIGSDPFGDGNKVWFKGRYSAVYFHSSAFKDMDIHDLPNLTPVATVPKPPNPAPVPAPLPLTGALHGADISNWQKDIDVAKLGGDFIGIKATEGVGYTDPFFLRNAEASKALVRIFYHFARPDTGNTAKAELEWFLSQVGPVLRTGDVLCLDWEKGDEPTLAKVDWVQEFLDGCAAKHGGTPLVYMGNAGINAAGAAWLPVESKYPLWYPAYNVSGEFVGFTPERAGARPVVTWGGKPMLIWQYTSSGKLPGYAGVLDLNVLYGTRQDLAALGVTKLGQAPAPAPDPEPVPEPVKQFPSADQPISALVDFYKE